MSCHQILVTGVIECSLRGRCKLESPVESIAKSVVEEDPTREDERIASRILVSNFFATISAAFPLGARMNGTWPSHKSESFSHVMRSSSKTAHTAGCNNTKQPCCDAFDLIFDLLLRGRRRVQNRVRGPRCCWNRGRYR
jgi:hypothetical protein